MNKMIFKVWYQVSLKAITTKDVISDERSGKQESIQNRALCAEREYLFVETSIRNAFVRVRKLVRPDNPLQVQWVG